MKFLADENFPLPSVRILSAIGHDIVAVAHDSPGVADEIVLGMLTVAEPDRVRQRPLPGTR